MSDLNIKDLKPSEAEKMDFSGYIISEKKDGTLIYFKDNKLFSPRCDRSDRFKHILKILIDNNFPSCMGEIFLDEPKSCVFDVSRSENWSKVKFYPFDLLDNSICYQDRQRILQEAVCCLNNNFIVPLRIFNTFKESWDYVIKNESEGLVIRNDKEFYKVKLLHESKMPIIAHEKGKDKGTFILENNNRVSGTSESFVLTYQTIKAKGKIPMCEIEYPFITKDGKFFQPRLRRVYEDN